MIGALNWVESEGGPLILMEEPLLKFWKGCFSLSSHSGDEVTDYDRACQVDDYLGIIAVGPGLALVLGDEPMQTAWWPIPESGGILVRWHWANDEGSVIKALSSLPEAIWQTSDLVFPASGSPLILFDSAFAGSEIESGLEINLPGEQYSIDASHFQPNKETSLFLHRLTLKAQ